jgi:dethiobiotin synthetase
MNYFVTAIGTDSGKTLVSAILCEALEADYWKPIQAGTPTDSELVRKLIANKKSQIHSEKYLLNTPASPHAAAKKEGIEIKLSDFVLPSTSNDLIIEGAGGCLVPLNDQDFVIDIADKLNLQIILVANLYLGSINHTLLTFQLLKNRNLTVKGIVFNGPPNNESERIILHHTQYKCLLRIDQENQISFNEINKYALKLKENWNE